MLNGFGTVVNALGLRAKSYLPQISGTVKVSKKGRSVSIYVYLVYTVVRSTVGISQFVFCGVYTGVYTVEYFVGRLIIARTKLICVCDF